MGRGEGSTPRERRRRGLWGRHRWRRWIGVGLVVTLALSVAALAVWRSVDPYRGATDDLASPSRPLTQTLTPDQAREDLTRAVDLVRSRHIWAADGLPEAVSHQLDVELAALSALASEPTVVQVWAALQRILVALGDGHTFAAAVSSAPIRYAVDYRLVDGELLVTVAEEDRPVVAVNGVPAQELVARNAELTPADNDGWVRARLERRLVRDTDLDLLGAAPGPQGYIVEYVEAGGAVRSLAVTGGGIPTDEPADDPPTAEYRIDPQRGLGVLTIHVCEVDDTYLSALENFFGEVAAAGLDTIAIDVRDNPGGSSAVADRFVGYLNVDEVRFGSQQARFGPWVRSGGGGRQPGRQHPDRSFGGEIFVLTNQETFSAATDLAVLLADNDLATVVGEPPGSAPSGAGDVIVFRLPHTGLLMQVSYKEFLRPDPTRDARVLEVDLLVDPEGSAQRILTAAGAIDP